MNTDGVMMPDNKPPSNDSGAERRRPIGGPKHRATAQPMATYAHVYASVASGSSYTITRNGQPWLTVKPQPGGGGVLLSDPSDSQQTVLTIVPKH
jgi:hypothetical protein